MAENHSWCARTLSSSPYFQRYKYGVSHSYRNWYLPRKRPHSAERDAKLPFRDSFKATHDLTELAVPTPQCLPLPHLTKTPQGPPLSSNLKSRHCFAELSVSFRRTHQAQDKRKDVSRGEMVWCKWEAEHSQMTLPKLSQTQHLVFWRR